MIPFQTYFIDLKITESTGISWSDFVWVTLVTVTEISNTVTVGETSFTKLGQSKGHSNNLIIYK